MNDKIIEIEENFDKAIDKAIKFLKDEFNLIRTGRANPEILNKIEIEYYGTNTPLNQVATIQVVEGTQLYIKPFDKTILKDIEKEINASDLNLPPVNDGTGIRLILPKLTGERRKELSKEVAKKAENAKTTIRNGRRDANNSVKALELSEDDEKTTLDDIQKQTDEAIIQVDKLAKEKTDEVMKI